MPPLAVSVSSEKQLLHRLANCLMVEVDATLARHAGGTEKRSQSHIDICPLHTTIVLCYASDLVQ